MLTILRLLAPYLAVGVFWVGFSNAWLAMLAYHAQILWFARGRIPKPRMPEPRWTLLIAAPSVLAGPVVWLLLPWMAGDALSAWLQTYGVTAPLLLLLLPYFGLVHPWLEQVHWHPLRAQTRMAHLFFAGYHVLVLWSLVPGPWLVAAFATLAGVSFFWEWLSRRSGSLVPAYLSHALADTGILLAAYFSM